MFSFTNPMINTHLNDSYDTYANRYNGINRNVIKMAKLEIKDNPKITHFLHELGTYLKLRMQEYRFFCFDNMRTVLERNNFIVGLVQLIENNDASGQLSMLKDENILRFKGFFSRRLYDILVTYRNNLEANTVSYSNKLTISAR